MKAAFALDQDAAVESVPERYSKTIVARKRMNSGVEEIVWVWPEGAVVEGDLALQIVVNGQGIPLDEECRKASGMTEEQGAKLRLEYEMTAKGINSAGDRELYRAGVIKGYDKNLKYIPGPKWDEYQKAKRDVEENDL